MAPNETKHQRAQVVGGEAGPQGRGEEGEETKTAMMIETDMLYAHVKAEDWLKQHCQTGDTWLHVDRC